MTVRQLERRVATLEDKVAQLASGNGPSGAAKDWRRTIGMFSGDELMKQIDEYARRFREADRRRGRRAGQKKRKARA